MAKIIDQALVTKYCKRARLLKKVEKVQKVVKEKINAALLAGEELPTGGPYVLDLSPVGGKESVDFEALYAALQTKIKMKKHGISEKVATELVKAEIEALRNSMPDKPAIQVGGKDYVGGIKLQPRVNEAYRVVEANKAVA
jgi:hypothetical protein